MSDKRGCVNGRVHHIRVKGTLDDKWADWFEGFAMLARSNGETLLTGPVVDQAALHGALSQIHSLGLPLLLLVEAECPCSSKNCSRRGQCQECVAKHALNGQIAYCFRERTKWDKQCAALIHA